MKCDELNAYKADVTIPVYGTIADSEVYLKKDIDKTLAEKDKEIAELQKTNAQLASSCVMLNKLLDTREEEVKTLKAKLEDVNELLKASKELLQEWADNASKQIRRLKRALWIARAKTAKAMKATDNLDNYLSIHENSKWFGIYATRIDTWYYKWDDVERKCLKKAEQYQ